MLRKIVLTGLLACLSLGWGLNLYAQENVCRAWGKSIGKAQTDRDFLIYDAVCADNKLFIVGKAESGTEFELKQGENTYFQTKDDYTDAFLACMSLDGELLWSTYLPALEDGYYNAFATTVEYTPYSTILVVGNAYQLQGDLENTKELIPQCPGKLFTFEFDKDRKLLISKNLAIQYIDDNKWIPLYIPRIIKSVSHSQQDSPIIGYNRTFLGFALCNFTKTPHLRIPAFFYSCPFDIHFLQSKDVLSVPFAFPFDTPDPIRYSAAYALNYVISNPSDHFRHNFILLTQNASTVSLDNYPVRFTGGTSSKSEKHLNFPSRGINLREDSPIFERWKITTEQLNHSGHEHGEIFRFYGYPTGTHVENSLVNSTSHKQIFPGTVQNIRIYKSEYIVQGIHCQNYSNGFFKTENGENYAYSHDTTHPIPRTEIGFYQSRNSRSTAVPYLLIYDSATLFGEQISEPDLPTTQETKDAYDFEAPLWGSYLDADWLYEDIFHVTDSAQWKDIYQPYEPVLCSYGNRFFLIGNAKYIDYELIDNTTIIGDFHHQGVVLAFSMCCPSKNTSFQDVRFLCPDDSVELKLSPGYAGFKFRFEPAYLKDGSIVLNADSSRAWAKKEGDFAATLDGSAFGCPDVTVDTVRISLSPFPEPVSFLNPDSTMAACAAVARCCTPLPNPTVPFPTVGSTAIRLIKKPCALPTTAFSSPPWK